VSLRFDWRRVEFEGLRADLFFFSQTTTPTSTLTLERTLKPPSLLPKPKPMLSTSPPRRRGRRTRLSRSRRRMGLRVDRWIVSRVDPSFLLSLRVESKTDIRSFPFFVRSRLGRTQLPEPNDGRRRLGQATQDAYRSAEGLPAQGSQLARQPLRAGNQRDLGRRDGFGKGSCLKTNDSRRTKRDATSS